MNIKWNADKYTQDFSFVHEYGNEVIGLINREEGASVLDLGCGNGALTKKLSEGVRAGRIPGAASNREEELSGADLLPGRCNGI